MTDFIRSYSEVNERSTTTLWRILGAGRFFEETRTKLLSQGHEVPSLDDPGCRASVESLELLRQLSRVVPKSELKPLELRTLLGEASRRELRSIWETYRPVLEGKTKRGRGKQEPKYDPSNTHMRGSMEEAQAIACIARAGSSWLYPQNDPDLFRLVPAADRPNLSKIEGFRFDLVVVAKAKQEQSVAVHGVEIVGDQWAERDRAFVSSETAPVDFMWMAVPNSPSQQLIALLDDRIGVICWSSVSIVRRARLIPTTKRNTAQREQLLRALVIEFAKSR